MQDNDTRIFRGPRIVFLLFVNYDTRHGVLYICEIIDNI